jgi:hypothetical protein
MRFLVITEAIDVGPVVPPQQTAQVIEQLVIPSLQILAQWEREGKAKGGSFIAERGGAMVLEADSVEQVDQMLGSLPFWGITKWKVRPLVSAETSVAQAQQRVQRIRSMAQQMG